MCFLFVLHTLQKASGSVRNAYDLLKEAHGTMCVGIVESTKALTLSAILALVAMFTVGYCDDSQATISNVESDTQLFCMPFIPVTFASEKIGKVIVFCKREVIYILNPDNMQT